MRDKTSRGFGKRKPGKASLKDTAHPPRVFKDGVLQSKRKVDNSARHERERIIRAEQIKKAENK